MLFVTNRRHQCHDSEPYHISFDLQDTSPSQEMLFCRRLEGDNYQHLSANDFFTRLSDAKQEHILFYIHGFNNTGEEQVFPHAKLMQQLFNDTEQAPDVLVVPLIWPCDDALIFLMDDYFDDQKAADKSHHAFAQLFADIHRWQQGLRSLGVVKKLHLLAHSMGNRVLSNAIKVTVEERVNHPPKLFQNIFMVAADLVNRAFEEGHHAEHVPLFTENLVIYHARDDLALRASQGVNLFSDGLSHRLGQKGPMKPEQLPEHVFLVDCDEINQLYDLQMVPGVAGGHEYFLMDKKKEEISPVFFHYAQTIAKGQVVPATRTYRFSLE